ncbi:hypothetical protein NZL82_12700 [Sphingomonas sanguinis]|jgi:hypothetical protein|uniref:hypothetical protein n=1 Tax=Sphingomonas sp. LC-1 TaxID=3110957 RepID=UPI0021BAB84B|nr:hypothetical protein [Sphingomonas sp. LC-1]MCT8002735.1 hypothetical protein [Sphingomonas sp. LC-1]
MIGFMALLIAALPAGAAVQAAPSAAAQPSIFDKAVNAPGIGWAPYGPNQTAKQVPASDVPGGNAVQIKVTKAGANPWDSGVTYPTIKPIAAGDTLMTMVFLRAPDAAEGQTVTIPVAMGGAEPPYPTITSEPLQVGSTWKRYFVTGVAAQAFAAGKANISVQLAGAKQVIEVGPAFLIDLGPNFDRSKLPRN